ncbi:MAG: hypothetical protein V4760_10095 [Bdellovibrionota bacterium]
MRIIRMALISFAALAIVSTAKADILLEPYLGYTYGQAKIDPVVGSGSTYDMNNLAVGARFGWQFLVAMVGLDYTMPVSGKFKATSTGATDYDYSGSQLWAYAGARLPLIRAWAGYSLTSTTELKDATGTSTITGDGLKVGASFTGFPLIAINAEYIMNNAKKIKSGAAEWDIPGTSYSKATQNFFMLSVSAPLSF